MSSAFRSFTVSVFSSSSILPNWVGKSFDIRPVFLFQYLGGIEIPVLITALLYWLWQYCTEISLVPSERSLPFFTISLIGSRIKLVYLVYISPIKYIKGKGWNSPKKLQ